MTKLKQITLKEARNMNLEEAGTASGENFPHSIYMMTKYCKEADKVEFYTIEISAISEKTGRGRQIVRFWKRKTLKTSEK